MGRAPKGNKYSNHPFSGDVLVSGRATLERSFTPEKRQLLPSDPNSSPKWRSLHPLKRSLTNPPQGGHWEEPGGMFQGNLLSILNLNQLLGHFWGIRIPLPITTTKIGVFPTQPVGKVANLFRRVTCHTTQGPPEEVARCQGGIRGHGVAASCWNGGPTRGPRVKRDARRWRWCNGSWGGCMQSWCWKSFFFFFGGGVGNIHHIMMMFLFLLNRCCGDSLGKSLARGNMICFFKVFLFSVCGVGLSQATCSEHGYTVWSFDHVWLQDLSSNIECV